VRHEALLDQDLAEALPGLLLDRERVLELCGGQQSALDEKRSQGPPVQWGRIHGCNIGTHAAGIERFRRPA
jgi:hypothetical protein